jgi:hypothetical protein
MIRRLLLNLDLRAGRLLPVKLPAYIREQILREGAGVYSREEWSRARRRGYRGAGINSEALDSDERYLNRIFSSHSRNLQAALRLLETFDFGPYNSVLELGCGEMVQAFAIKCAYPGMRYRATDFDAFIVDKCGALPILRALEKSVVDASRLTSADIAGFRLVVSWEMIYALDDAQLLNLFKVCGDARIPFLACTTQMIGPVRFLLGWLRQRGWREDLSAATGQGGGVRMHGWNPSLRHYDALSRKAGLRLSRVWHPPALLRGGDDFSYLLFLPD